MGKEVFNLVLQDKLPLLWTAKIIWHNIMGKEVFSLVLQDKLPLFMNCQDNLTYR